MQKELELKKSIICYLQNWFVVDKECYTNTNGNKGFIDILMWHKSDESKGYPLGIEVKLPDDKTGSQVGKWMKQAKRYQESIFSGHKPLVILYPQVSGLYIEEGLKMSKHNVYEQSINTKDYTIAQPHQHNGNTILFELSGTGELQKFLINGKSLGLRIIINSRHIWDNINPEKFNYKNYNYIKNIL